MEFFLPRMERKNLFLSLLLCYSLFRAADHHMVIEEKTECSLSRNNKMNFSDLPPISITDLTKRSQRVSRKEAETQKSSKKKAGSKTSLKPRPTPAADCVPNFKTCRPHLNSCCNYCAFCKCRIFQTICKLAEGTLHPIIQIIYEDVSHSLRLSAKEMESAKSHNEELEMQKQNNKVQGGACMQ